MVSTGYRGHYINVEFMGDNVGIDIKGPVLVDGYTLAVDRTARLWSEPPIAWAQARIDLAIETHAHTYSSRTIGCNVCQTALVPTIPMTPELIAAIKFANGAALRQLSDGCAALGKDFPDLTPWREHVTRLQSMLDEVTA